MYLAFEDILQSNTRTEPSTAPTITIFPVLLSYV